MHNTLWRVTRYGALVSILFFAGYAYAGDNHNDYSNSRQIAAKDRSDAGRLAEKVKATMGKIEDKGLSILVLGSGGPAAGPKGRASAGYLVFVDGEPTLLMDAGGGTFQRLAQSGVNIKDLPYVLLTHLHVDHSSDLPAILKTIFFHGNAAGDPRTSPIKIFGPGPGKGITFPDSDITQYPPTTEFVDHEFGMEGGVYRYLHAFAPAVTNGQFNVETTDLAADYSNPMMHTLIEDGGLTVKSMPVKHGPAPAVAYRIEYKGRSIVFSGDTNSETDNMVQIAIDADLLIYDTAILDDAPANPVMFQLHTTPTRMGQVAAAANPDTLVLSHITGVTEGNLNEVKQTVKRQGYNGKIRTARDLQVYNLGD
ncbi:MAG: MBL fold metallo-hydrolase [Gammaproteobacteria bacterium]